MCDYQLVLGPRTGGYFGGERPVVWRGGAAWTRFPPWLTVGATRDFLCLVYDGQSAFWRRIGRKVQMSRN